MEQLITQWISSHLATVVTWIISIGAVGVVIKKYGPRIRKFIKVGRESMDIIDTLLDALKDDKVTDDEIRSIIKEVNDFKEAVK